MAILVSKKWVMSRIVLITMSILMGIDSYAYASRIFGILQNTTGKRIFAIINPVDGTFQQIGTATPTAGSSGRNSSFDPQNRILYYSPWQNLVAVDVASGTQIGSFGFQIDGLSASLLEFEFVSEDNAACGNSDGSNVKIKPSIDLCTTGTASTVAGSGPWTWTCNGHYGGTNVSCSANLLDTTPPTITLTSSPLNYSNQSLGTIAFNADETATFQCKVDSGNFATCTSPFSYSNLVNGQHTVAIKATDGSGNASTSTHTWTVNTSLAASSVILLPDTGQTKCYGAVSPYAEIPCAGTGQDGAYITNPMSFTDNGNGTITDNKTGLVWQKCTVGQNNDASCSGTATAHNWYQATGTYEAAYNPATLNICGTLALAGGGWRLPNKKDLTGIIDYSIPSPGPTIAQVTFPNTITSRYWSSIIYAYVQGNALSVGFNGGYVDISSKSYSNYVRCVRGGQ